MEHAVTSIVEDPELIQKRRGQIVQAATQLFSAQGFYQTTIKEIAKLANISPGLVYQYVREKSDVLLLVLLDVLEAYARDIPAALAGVEDPLERLTTAFAAYCHVVDKHRAATILAYRSTKSLPPEKRALVQQKEIETNQWIGREIDNCIKCGLLQPVGGDILTYQLVMIAHGWALKSWHLKTLTDVDSYIRQTLDTVFLGLLTPQGKKRFAALAE